jgi:hypothetical protein
MEEKQGEVRVLFEGSLLSRIVSRYGPTRRVDQVTVF